MFINVTNVRRKHTNMTLRSLRRCYVSKSCLVVLSAIIFVVIFLKELLLYRTDEVTHYTIVQGILTFVNNSRNNVLLKKLRVAKKAEKGRRCVIPDLNPYDPELLPYLQKPHLEKCRIKKYGVVDDDGVLRLNVSNVVLASGAYIERDGDFAIKMTGYFDLLNGNSTIKNHHQECWKSCGSQGGPCPSFCGTDGLCCRQGWANCSQSIPDLTDQHRCVSGVQSSLKNFHQECWESCGSQGGPCPGFCGSNGLCCRKGWANCSQAIPDLVDQHRCVSGVQLKAKDLNITHRLQKEFIKINLIFNDERKEHEEYHFAFPKKPSEEKWRRKLVKKKVNGSGLNIAILLFDSVSHAHAVRSIKKTYNYLEQHPRTVIMKGQSIVGDGTTAQLCAMLTGVPEKDLPEARRGFPKSKPVDDWPWIFKDMHAANYKTMYSEQTDGSGTFQYRLKGFTNSPVTHYARPLWLASEWGPITKGGLSCAHQFNLEYLSRFFDAYKDEKKFALVFSAILHNTADKLENTDDDILRFYENFSRSDHAKNTVLILMGDHGLRTSTFRTTLQGKLEERLPLLAITLPPTFDSFPNETKTLVQNSQLMTSHFDTYSTLQHLRTFPRLNPKVTNKYGKSLFTNIGKLNRGCADAGVDQHWCTCLNYQVADPKKDANVLKLANKVIAYINDLNRNNVGDACAVLTLRKVIRSGRSTPNAEVNQFTGTGTRGNGCDSCDVKYDKKKHFNRFRYQINFSVSPSGGEYEADGDVYYDSKGFVNIALDTQVSRTNLYGNQSSCIAARYPHLRPYCLCSDLKHT